jgi:iron complex transport system substrate-binding protein
VGRSHECDYPDSVKELPICTAPKFPIDLPSRDIDRHVKSLVGDALSVYRVDEDLLARLQPDVILTQSQCEVCAVSERDVAQALAGWLGSLPRVISLKPNSLGDVWQDIETVAERLNRRAEGQYLVAGLRKRIDLIANQAKQLPHPTVACIEWLDPLMAAGNWVPELVELAGGDNCFGTAGKHAPWMTWEQLQYQDPEFIVLMPCGFDISRTSHELPALTSQPDWVNLQAVQNRQVYLTDGNQFFNRPGPRLVESVEILAEVFHPEVFHFGHEATGWQRL